jgi:YggT family protein
VIFIRLVDAAAAIYVLMICIRAFMTWLRPEAIYQFKQFFDLIAGLTDPFLKFIRRFFPVNFGRVDISPVIAVLLVEIARFMLISLIRAVLIKYAA